MSAWYIARRVFFIAIGFALAFTPDVGWFGVALGWLCVVVNALDLTLGVVKARLEARLTPTDSPNRQPSIPRRV